MITLGQLRAFIAQIRRERRPERPDTRRTVDIVRFGPRVGGYCLIGRFPAGVWVWVSMN